MFFSADSVFEYQNHKETNFPDLLSFTQSFLVAKDNFIGCFGHSEVRIVVVPNEYTHGCVYVTSLSAGERKLHWNGIHTSPSSGEADRHMASLLSAPRPRRHAMSRSGSRFALGCSGVAGAPQAHRQAGHPESR